MADAETPAREFEIFKAAIREENLELQIEMTRRLGSLAELLGAEITRKELLPFIKENIDFHDEVLLNLSEQLNRFVPLVGGYEHSQPILDLLMKLCNTDETIVRNKSLETLTDIAQHLNSELTEELFIPMIEALNSEDWFTSKCSAVALYPTIYSKVRDERKTELRHSFRILLQDDSPIVRKAAANTLVEMIPAIEKECIINEFVPVLDNVLEDCMDSVKVVAIPIAIALSKRLTENEVEEFVFKTLMDCAGNSSWKIRQVLARHIADIQEAIPFGKMRGRILSIFQGFVRDSEAEVRILAAENISSYCRNLKKSYEIQPEDNFEPVFQQSIVPYIMLLSDDRNDDVRIALSRNILDLGSIVREKCFRETTLPIVIDLLEHDHTMLIQAHLLQNLNSLPDEIDLTKSLLSFKKVVNSLIKNSEAHWRTRMSLLVAFMHIARFAKKEYFAKNLKTSYAALLGDPVFAVRRTAPVILPLLAKQYGIDWASEHLIPYFKMFRKDRRYLYRFVPLFGILELINPSVVKEGAYLRDLKGLCSSTNVELRKAAASILMGIRKMTMKLKEKLEEDSYKHVLSLNNFIYDFKTDNILLYAGDCLKVFKENRNCDIFSMDEKTVLEGTPTYLEGLLSLLHKEFLELTLSLYDDPIINVHIRSIFILSEIKQFTDKLCSEMEEPWVAEVIQLFSKEESDAIEKKVEVELDRKLAEPDEEEINTDLMEDSIDDAKKLEQIDFIDSSSNLMEIKIPEIKVEEVVEQEEISEGGTNNVTNEELPISMDVDTALIVDTEPVSISLTAEVSKED